MRTVQHGKNFIYGHLSENDLLDGINEHDIIAVLA